MDPQSRMLGLPHVSPFVEQDEPTAGQGAPASSVSGQGGRGPTPQAGCAGPTGAGHTGQPQVLYQRRPPESIGGPASSRTLHAWPNAGQDFTIMHVGVQYASKPGQQRSPGEHLPPLQSMPPVPELAPELLPEPGAPDEWPEPDAPDEWPEPGAPALLPELGPPEETPELGAPDPPPDPGVPEAPPEEGAPEESPALAVPEELPEAGTPELLPEPSVPDEEDPESEFVPELPPSSETSALPLQPPATTETANAKVDAQRAVSMLFMSGLLVVTVEATGSPRTRRLARVAAAGEASRSLFAAPASRPPPC
jgi:hypothetical protein